MESKMKPTDPPSLAAVLCGSCRWFLLVLLVSLAATILRVAWAEELLQCGLVPLVVGISIAIAAVALVLVAVPLAQLLLWITWSLYGPGRTNHPIGHVHAHEHKGRARRRR